MLIGDKIMSLRLYQLADEYKFLQDNLINEDTGEINEATMNRLTELNKPLQDKCINTVRVLKGLEAEYKAIEEERKAMQARENALKSQVAWIKGYLLTNMEKSNINEISCPQFVIKLKNNPESTMLDFDFNGEDKYWRIKKEPALDIIKADLKAGIDIPGARLIQKHSLSIK